MEDGLKITIDVNMYAHVRYVEDAERTRANVRLHRRRLELIMRKILVSLSPIFNSILKFIILNRKNAHY